MPEFRITVVLSEFFLDYRARSRLFVNNEIRTIADLTKYIRNNFRINTNFFLMCDNVYLPPTEDVRLLKEDDVIFAVAIQEHDQIERKQTKRKSEYKKEVNMDNASNSIIQRSESDIEQAPNTLNSEFLLKNYKKNKNKKIHMEVDNELEYSSALETSKNSLSTGKNSYFNKRKKARKETESESGSSSVIKDGENLSQEKLNKNIQLVHEDSHYNKNKKVYEETSNNSEHLYEIKRNENFSVEKFSENSELNQEASYSKHKEIFKEGQNKLDAYDLKKGEGTELTQNNLNYDKIKNNASNSGTDFSPYSCIKNFKAPHKRPVKFMEISPVPKIIQTIHVNNTTPTAGGVFDTVKDNAPDLLNEHTPLVPLTNTSDFTTYAADKSPVLLHKMHSLPPNSYKNICNLNTAEKVESKDCQLKTENINRHNHADQLQQAKQSLLDQIKSKFEHISRANKSISCEDINLTGTSDLENSGTVKSSPTFSTDEFYIDLTNPASCRRRKRKRVKQSKKLEVNESKIVNAVSCTELPFITPKNGATHIRFDASSPKKVENVAEGKNEASTTDNDTIKIVRNESVASSVLSVSPSLKAADILKYPLLGDHVPREGDIVAFKLLVMSQSYTPEISDYIIAHILRYTISTKSVVIKILEGKEQCSTPLGKFFIKEYVTAGEDEVREFHLNQLLELRLLYP